MAIVAVGAVAASVATLYAVHQWNARWVAHSRTVARVARDLRVATVDGERTARASAGSSALRIAPSADSARRSTRALADTLARFTADNPAQHRAAEQIRAAVERWDSAATTVQPRRGPGPIAAEAWSASAGRVTEIERAEGAFLQAEDLLYAQRLRRERVWQVATLVTVLAELTALTLVLLRFRRQLVAEAVREVDQQAQLEEQAIELEAQASELEEANADLSRAAGEASLARGVTESIVREQQALIRALPDTVLVFDRSGRMLKVESTAGTLLSRPPEAMLGRSLHELLPQETADRCLAAIHEALGEQHLVEVEYDVSHADRVVSWAATASPMGRGIVVWVARDITDRRAHELQQRQRHKLEAIGQLAGGVAHDFNNMLTAIRAYAQLALGEVDAASAVADDLREIDSAATRAAALTRQLLAFSRNQALQPRFVTLAEVVAGVERMLQRLLVGDVRLCLERSPDDGLVYLDPGQIEQVVMNLAVNARDAMPEGGELRIETSATILTEPYHRDAFEIPPGDYATLTVEDEGTGMTPETLARIFEPFFTTKAVGRGTGLGLATVYGIVQQSGGHLAVETAVGKGTRFTVYFPHTAPELLEQAPSVAARSSPSAPVPPIPRAEQRS